MKGNNPMALPVIVTLVFALILGGYGVTMLVRNVLKIPTTREVVDKALKLKQAEQINEALAAVANGRGRPRAEVLEALSGAAKHSDPHVKLRAAELLYIMGDTGGRAALVQLMESGGSAEPSGKVSKRQNSPEDLRVQAAAVLGKYRDEEAAPAVMRLYRRTQLEGLMSPLVLTKSQGAEDIVKSTLGAKPPSELLMQLYGRLKAQDQADTFAGLHQDEKAALLVRLAAAWAHTQLPGGTAPAALQFIHSHVESQVSKRTYSETAHKAVKYLGSLKDDKSVKLLEKVALECPQVRLMQTAVVNLVLLHAERSAVGRELVVRELSSPGKLGRDLAIRLAAASGHPDLAKAGEAFDARRASTGELIWRWDGLERRQWSIWSWADEHLMVTPEES